MEEITFDPNGKKLIIDIEMQNTIAYIKYPTDYLKPHSFQIHGKHTSRSFIFSAKY